MARNFEELRAKMSPERRERNRAESQRLLAEMDSAAARGQAGKMTEDELSAILGARQPSLSEVEGRPDVNISTLRRIVEAMGGTLEITARFPSRSVALTPSGAADAPEQS